MEEENKNIFKVFKVFDCPDVKEMFENVYIKSDVKKCGQNTRYLMLFSMFLRCEIGIEDDEFGLQGCFGSLLNSHEIWY